jgi:hypothetical protein
MQRFSFVFFSMLSELFHVKFTDSKEINIHSCRDDLFWRNFANNMKIEKGVHPCFEQRWLKIELGGQILV